MANVFLDANVLVDLLENKQHLSPEDLAACEVYYSPLSVHIIAYLFKYKMPEDGLSEALENYITVSFDDSILNLALKGPTKDLEDNIQLHSAKKADCELFLTFDKELLKMKEFGTVKIVDHVHETERS